ncbi:hypothetical protein VTL71DRAFT_1175 [Oculimacula yallundae]|uniref:Uncharacterized protein n=1 Tax=Oculimacula yallundae TaxID=86028 RepID=A0ABR4D345_9HELO
MTQFLFKRLPSISGVLTSGVTCDCRQHGKEWEGSVLKSQQASEGKIYYIARSWQSSTSEANLCDLYLRIRGFLVIGDWRLAGRFLSTIWDRCRSFR